MNMKTGLAFSLYLALVTILLNIFFGLLVEKEINWVISLAIGFCVFCGAIIGFRHTSKR